MEKRERQGERGKKREGKKGRRKEGRKRVQRGEGMEAWKRDIKPTVR